MDNPAVVFPAQRRVEITNRPLPPLGPGHMLVKAERTLISIGTELTALSGEFPRGGTWDRMISYPLWPGYDHVGRVVEVGQGVDASWVGRRVGSLTRHMRYGVVTPASVRPIGDDVSPDHACFFTLAEIAMNGVRRGRVTWGESAVVFGLGLVGQLTVDFCRLAGARPVIGVDTAGPRLRRLPNAACVVGVNPAAEAPSDAVRRLTRERLADVAFEVTGAPDAIPPQFAVLRPLGRLVLLSSPRGPCSFDFHDLCNAPSFTIIGAHNRSHPAAATPDNPWTNARHCEMFLDLVAAGELDVERLITHRAPYAEAPAIYSRILEDRSDFLGVVLNWET
jgi:2-desacetyl-2-hydroxyethyl bacteriochlorophyllide A dehydrogenase